MMKTYTFDYTLPAEAEKMAHQAYIMCQDEEMKKLLEGTVLKLRQFLAQDNMVEDADCEGWVRRGDAENAIVFDDDACAVIRDSMLELIELQPKASVNQERLAIINSCQERDCNPTFDSVEQLLTNTSNTWTEIESCEIY